ncbi:lactate utilization protein [Clostridium rectalis]|uniref:lactate utilization protein n=1 Tax=Clostridium rectalis TaxID=2040295 RepID=UPI000F642551|nr:lactate utilization protein [Clostridium rectalis]
MDKNLLWHMKKKVNKVIENLNKNNIDGFYVENEKELKDKLNEVLKDNMTVSVGGSMTLFESGVIDFLRSGKYNFLDRYKENLSIKEIENIYKKTFFADAYITSTNALTEQGELYNIDGNGNRVAAMIYGPDQVIIIAGINKIVKDINEAKKRLREIAAPINAKRLNKNTPCTKVGYCMDCSSEDRICSSYVVLRRQRNKGRIKVIIVGKDLGY